jgi:hypothetical protein
VVGGIWASRRQKEGAKKGVIVFPYQIPISMAMFPFLRHENMVVRTRFLKVNNDSLFIDIAMHHPQMQQVHQAEKTSYPLHISRGSDLILR